jgi:pantoate--beta-alanine ligase
MTELIRDPAELRTYVRMLHRNRISIGCVPTLGALHEGHESLIRRSYRENDRTIVTVFVNPLQFGPGEDFERYPRDLEGDVLRSAQAGADVVFSPSVASIQPPGRSTLVHVAGVSHDFEGAQRPGHFDGVATVCATLFHLAQPDRAYFGQKDYQQTVVIRRMVLDLQFPLDVVVCATVRDADGLALSSRNRYLSVPDRTEALRLPGALRAVEDAVRDGECHADALRRILRSGLESQRKDVEMEYADVVHPDTLVPVGEIGSRAVAVAVLRVGGTRLLDNCIVSPPGTPAWEE